MSYRWSAYHLKKFTCNIYVGLKPIFDARSLDGFRFLKGILRYTL